MAKQAIQVRQVPSMGETPAEARQRAAEAARVGVPDKQMQAGTTVTQGQEVPELTAEHLSFIREAEEGFSAPSAKSATVETGEETTEPPSPEKAMNLIRQLSQEKIQAISERDAALALVERYKSAFGEVD